jgi:hypothetical protein
MTPTPLWTDPTRWRHLRLAVRRRVLGSGLIILATLLFMPAIWIVTMPVDPTFHPDQMRLPAMVALGVCPALIWLGRRVGRQAATDYGAALYGCIAATRRLGEREHITFDIEFSTCFPRILIARKDRLMGVALPEPVLVEMDRITAIKVLADNRIQMVLSEDGADSIIVLAGNGLDAQSPQEARYVCDRLREFVFQPNVEISVDEMRAHGALRDFQRNPSLTH